MIKRTIHNIRYRSRLTKFEQMMTFLKVGANDKLLEVGIAGREYSEVDNFLIKKFPYPKNITALGIGDLSEFRKRYPSLRAISYDGGIFPFHDKEFDIAHSNAVIEHVGSREAQECFLREIVRVSRRGMMTTPNRRFIFETHTRVPFMHWMGKEWFDRFLKVIGKGWAAGGYMHLLSFRELDSMAKRAGIKNYRIIRNRFFGFTMTFSLIWNESN